MIGHVIGGVSTVLTKKNPRGADCDRSERGQIIVMFAVLVPIFLAMLTFVVDVGKMYLEDMNSRQVADSVARTVEKILSNGTSGGVLIAESDIPSSAKSYLSYDELKAEYPDAADTLKTLKGALDVFESMNVVIDQQYGVDSDGNLYCLITVSKLYKTIMKIAGAISTATNLGIWMQQLNNATTEEERSAVVLVVLNTSSEMAGDDEKGAFFDVYLSSELNETQLNGVNATTLKTTKLAGKPNITPSDANKILILMLQTMPNVSNINPSSSGIYNIIYEDSKTDNRYHKIEVGTNTSDVITVKNYNKDTPYA